MLIKKKVKIFTKTFNIQKKELTFFNRWLYKFKKYNNIYKYCIYEELESVFLVYTYLQKVLVHPKNQMFNQKSCL